MAKDRSHLTDRQLAEEWQAFHGEHLRRQTAALESIRALLLVLLVLGIAGGVISAALVQLAL